MSGRRAGRRGSCARRLRRLRCEFDPAQDGRQSAPASRRSIGRAETEESYDHRQAQHRRRNGGKGGRRGGQEGGRTQTEMCIAVTDEGGDLKAFQRMDGAPKLSIQISQDKAYTAASFSMPTHAWFDFIKDDPPLLHGITHTPRLMVFGGGFRS